MVPLATNDTIGKITIGTIGTRSIGRTPNRAMVKYLLQTGIATVNAILVINPIEVDSLVALFNCTPVNRAPDSMMAPTLSYSF